jgi:hypothetical protein
VKTSLEREQYRIHKFDLEVVFEEEYGYDPEGHDYLEIDSESDELFSKSKPEMPEKSHSEGTDDECPTYERPVWGPWWQHM